MYYYGNTLNENKIMYFAQLFIVNNIIIIKFSQKLTKCVFLEDKSNMNSVHKPVLKNTLFICILLFINIEFR
jgi:hypothetical protein